MVILVSENIYIKQLHVYTLWKKYCEKYITHVCNEHILYVEIYLYNESWLF